MLFQVCCSALLNNILVIKYFASYTYLLYYTKIVYNLKVKFSARYRNRHFSAKPERTALFSSGSQSWSLRNIKSPDVTRKRKIVEYCVASTYYVPSCGLGWFGSLAWTDALRYTCRNGRLYPVGCSFRWNRFSILHVPQPVSLQRLYIHALEWRA